MLATLTVLLVFAGTARAGQIVYEHGNSFNSEIWAMNDDGSDQHRVLDQGDVPLSGITAVSQPNIFPAGGTSIAFTATTAANVDLATGSCGLNCEGLYVFTRGGIFRVSEPPVPCACSSFNTYPHWAPGGNIDVNHDLINPGVLGYAEEDVTSAPAAPNTGDGSPLNLPKAEWISTLYDPINESAWATPDPTGANIVAFTGEPENCHGLGVPECSGRRMFVGAPGGALIPAGGDEWFVESPVWSSDGAHLAVLQGGEERGIWTFGPEEEGPAKKYIWALADPIQSGKSERNNTTIHEVSWIGASEIVFVANGDIWKIPASCGTTGTPCHFPGDAKQLTSDGQDHSPSWTSATQPLLSSAPTTAQIAAALRAGIAPGKGARIAKVLKGGYSLTVHALEAGTVVVDWYHLPHGATLSTKTKHKPKPVLVATGKHNFAAASSATVKVNLTTPGKRLLKHSRRVSLIARGIFIPVSGANVSATKSFAVKH